MDGDTASGSDESEEEDGKPKKVPCESLRITYEDPLSRVQRAEDGSDGGLSGPARPLVTRTKLASGEWNCLGFHEVRAVVHLSYTKGSSLFHRHWNEEQNFALSSQSATERCRRDYLREQRLLVDELQRLLELELNIPKAMQAEAQQFIDQAMDIAENGPDASEMVFTDADSRNAVEFYVPRHDEDDEILEHLTKAQVDLGDEVCTRLLVQKVRSINSEDLRKREQMKQMLEDLAGSDLNSEKGPGDIEGRIKLIHGMIIQAQNQGASWTSLGVAPQQPRRSTALTSLVRGPQHAPLVGLPAASFPGADLFTGRMTSWTRLRCIPQAANNMAKAPYLPGSMTRTVGSQCRQRRPSPAI
eukprot:g16948.t1